MEENPATTEPESNPGGDSPRRRWAKRLGWLLAGIVAVLLLAMLVLNSSLGKRFIVGQIASYAPASGLTVDVERIEGDVFRDAILRNVEFSDPQGVFLTIPEIELEWRPLSWLSSGLDVRQFTARGGELLRVPQLLPGDPDAPILPDFDIRIDHFEVDQLIVAPGVATDQAEIVNLVASSDIRDGLVSLSVDGRIGAKDRVKLELMAEPDGDRFDLDLDYRAPSGGVIAGLTGADQDHTARILGDGTWSDWLGHALVKRGKERAAALRLTNRSGRYGAIGEVYPSDPETGLIGRALGPRAGIIIDGTFAESRFDGTARLLGAGIDLRGEGIVDLDENSFDRFAIAANLLDPGLFGEGVALTDAFLRAELDGEFRELTLAHEVEVAELVIGEIVARGVEQGSVGEFDGTVLRVPVKLSVDRIVSGVAVVDEQLLTGALSGDLIYSDGLIRADALAVTFPRLRASLALQSDLSAGTVRVSGPVSVRGVAIEGIGEGQASGRIDFSAGGSSPWSLDATLGGRLSEFTNATLRDWAGEVVSFRTSLAAGDDAPIQFVDLLIRSPKIDFAGAASIGEAGFGLDLSGEHTRFGPVDAQLRSEHGHIAATAKLASPFPSADIRDVELAIESIGQGFRIDATGQSLLGRFDGLVMLALPEDRAAVVDIERLRVWETNIEGKLALEQDGARGTLSLAGGGLDGTIALFPEPQGQAFRSEIIAKDAIFGGATRIELGEAEFNLSGHLGEQASTLNGALSGRAIRYDGLFLGRVAARVSVTDGEGKASAFVVGRQGGRFNLQIDSDFSSGRIATIARGDYSGIAVSMPRRAILSRSREGQWQLAPTRIEVGEGGAVIAGQFGRLGNSLDLKLDQVPLALADLAQRDLGLGGSISGLATYSSSPGTAPTGNARIRVSGLTRAGLLVASTPVDLALVTALDAQRLTAKALVIQRNERLGWIDAEIDALPRGGSLFDRLQDAELSASMHYSGSAEALWRLVALDIIDLSGPVDIRAIARGSLAEPVVQGKLSSQDLRVRSALSGTDIQNIRVRGDFEGSRLNLRSFAGSVGAGGSISGSGTVDLANLEPGRGPEIDLRASAKGARLLDAQGLNATVTGPIRIVSTGVGGTIAGRLDVDSASWRLGSASQDFALPNIRTREINLPAEIERSTAPAAPWRYLIDARARNRIDVDGLGLDSEWRGDIILRGTTADPRIGGQVRAVRGSYSFAGTTFDLSRGRINFDENVPIDPRLDIVAETRRNGLDVDVTVRGNALSPEISFTSDPALPEEEILSRLLFGGPITELSATDTLQLGAAVASLRGGGGLDPVNRLRQEIGLDRLRIVGADPIVGRQSGVALGENLGRRFYVELITDGREYSATQLEFRITSWLSLLASVSTVGRDSVLVEARRDY